MISISRTELKPDFASVSSQIHIDRPGPGKLPLGFVRVLAYLRAEKSTYPCPTFAYLTQFCYESLSIFSIFQAYPEVGSAKEIAFF
jgi:hypothetical protein